MKNLIAGFLLLFASTAFGQGTAGINPEHLWLNGIRRTNHLTQGSQPEVKTIQLSTGVKLQYAEQGAANGVPVIFLHGICDSWHSFEMVLRHLPHSVHAFSLTQRGHGDSEKPLSGYASTDFAADVAAFIRQKELGSVIVVGHSMGGVHAQTFAVRYPQLTRGLVLVNTDPAFRNIQGGKEFQLEVMQLKGVSWEFMEAFQKACISRPIDSAFFRLLVDEAVKIPLPVFQTALNGIMDTDFTTSLKDLQCPALIIWGDQDVFCQKAGQDVLAKQLKFSTFKVYEGVGHSPHWQEPERVANDLSRFIQTIPVAGTKQETKNKQP